MWKHYQEKQIRYVSIRVALEAMQRGCDKAWRKRRLKTRNTTSGRPSLVCRNFIRMGECNGWRRRNVPVLSHQQRQQQHLSVLMLSLPAMLPCVVGTPERQPSRDVQRSLRHRLLGKFHLSNQKNTSSEHKNFILQLIFTFPRPNFGVFIILSPVQWTRWTHPLQKGRKHKGFY